MCNQLPNLNSPKFVVVVVCLFFSGPIRVHNMSRNTMKIIHQNQLKKYYRQI